MVIDLVDIWLLLVFHDGFIFICIMCVVFMELVGARGHELIAI